MQPEPQVLTAGIGDVIPALFIVIALVTGFLNFMKEKKNANDAEEMRDQRKGRRNDGGDDELSQFLDEVGSSSATAPPKRRRRQRQTQRDRTQQRRQRRKKTEQQPQDRPRRSPTRTSSVASRHLDTEELSQVHNRHVHSAVEDRHLDSQVADQHLYETDRIDAVEPGDDDVPHPIAAMLSEPAGIRNAILLNEILQPPLSRRKG